MSNTKALTQLGFVTARGLDNGELGALLLSNKVGVSQSVRQSVSLIADNDTNTLDGREEKELFEVERVQRQEGELQVS